MFFFFLLLGDRIKWLLFSTPLITILLSDFWYLWALSPINCARWDLVNVDTKTTACEGCGARNLFSTPPSYNQQQGMPLLFFLHLKKVLTMSGYVDYLSGICIFSVEKAASAISLKPDNSHKLLCPWIDNACDETLARFRDTSPLVLVGNFKEHYSAPMQVSALPLISSSAVDYMKSHC